jgi:deoxyribonuclease (pyrimidine dimer)
MTRINADINPKALTDQHLMAEWREIKMVPKALKRSLKTKSVQEVLSSIPKKFCLNTGHVKHFYDKMDFLAQRYQLLTNELVDRGYNIDVNAEFDTTDIPYVFFRNTSYSSADREVVKQRIMTRVGEKPDFYRFKSKLVTPEEYQKILTPYI